MLLSLDGREMALVYRSTVERLRRREFTGWLALEMTDGSLIAIAPDGLPLVIVS